MSTETPQKAALRKAAQILGGQAALAAVCGYPDRRNVYPYFNTDRDLPEKDCILVEDATRLKGEPVWCEQLRPDVRWDLIRGARSPISAPTPTPTAAEPAHEPQVEVNHG